MRSLEYADQEDIDNIKAQPWQMDLLKMNPSYTGWGPHEDYMWVQGEGWNSPSIKENWEEFREWKLNDLNECVNFYFELNRKAENCSCDGGYHPDAKTIVDSFYQHSSPNGTYWKDKITQDEYEVLLEKGRVDCKNHQAPKEERVYLTREEVNNQNAYGAKSMGLGMGHDSINRHILTQARLKRLGIPELCPVCDGKAYNYVENFATVRLILWMIHPRKGASRGVEIKNITHENLPEVFAYLREAAERNANRFSQIPK